MATIVTEENNPGLYASLHAMWLAEGKRGWVVNGSKQYRVIQNAETQAIEFLEKGTQELYETTSFR